MITASETAIAPKATPRRTSGTHRGRVDGAKGTAEKIRSSASGPSERADTALDPGSDRCCSSGPGAPGGSGACDTSLVQRVVSAARRSYPRARPQL